MYADIGILFLIAMISYYRSTIQSPRMKKQTKLQPGCWIKSEKPTEANLQWLTSLRLDEDTLRDALDPYEVPRLERDEVWTYYIARLPDANDELGGFTTPILFAISDRYLVTVSRDNLSSLWQPFMEHDRIPTTQRGKLFLAIIGAIVEQYERQLAIINRRMRAIMLDVSNIRVGDVAIFTENERKVNDYLDALVPMNTALEKLLNSKALKLFDNDADMVEDLSIDLEQLVARCKSQLRTITNLRDSYRAMMDSQLNATMRLLTVITVVMTIPTVVAGIFGMNVDLPGGGTAADFWWIIGLTSIAALVVAIYFMRRR